MLDVDKYEPDNASTAWKATLQELDGKRYMPHLIYKYIENGRFGLDDVGLYSKSDNYIALSDDNIFINSHEHSGIRLDTARDHMLVVTDKFKFFAKKVDLHMPLNQIYFNKYPIHFWPIGNPNHLAFGIDKTEMEQAARTFSEDFKKAEEKVHNASPIFEEDE